MSQSGLATLAGVNQSTIQRLEKSLMREASAESLEPFLGNEKPLMREIVLEPLESWLGKVRTLTTNAPSQWLEPWLDKAKTLTTDAEYKNAPLASGQNETFNRQQESQN